MAVSTQLEEKSGGAFAAMQARGTANLPGPDDDVESWPWWLKIRGQPGVAVEKSRYSQKAAILATSILNSIKLEAAAKSAGKGAEGMVSVARAMLVADEEFTCGNDLAWWIWLLRHLPTPPPPPEPEWYRFEALSILGEIRMSMPKDSPVGVGIEGFLGRVSERFEKAKRG